MSVGLALLLAASLWQQPDAAQGVRVATAEAACARVKAFFTQERQVPDGVIGYCDPIDAADSPDGFYVLGLRSTRECDYICSNLMGWFAVERTTGRIFDWDDAEWRAGEPIDAQP